MRFEPGAEIYMGGGFTFSVRRLVLYVSYDILMRATW